MAPQSAEWSLNKVTRYTALPDRIVVWPKPYQARSVHRSIADLLYRQVHFVPTFGFMQRSKISWLFDRFCNTVHTNRSPAHSTLRTGTKP
jgi:hypothetical protein